MRAYTRTFLLITMSCITGIQDWPGLPNSADKVRGRRLGDRSRPRGKKPSRERRVPAELGAIAIQEHLWLMPFPNARFEPANLPPELFHLGGVGGGDCSTHGLQLRPMSMAPGGSMRVWP